MSEIYDYKLSADDLSLLYQGLELLIAEQNKYETEIPTGRFHNLAVLKSRIYQAWKKESK
jgi:hypothetical protein